MNVRVDTADEGLPHNPFSDHRDPNSFAFLTAKFRALSLDDHNDDIKIIDTSLRLHSDWTYRSVQGAFGVDDIDEDFVHTAILQEQEICLRNLRHVARFHGFDLQNMLPEIISEQGALPPASDQPSSPSPSVELSPGKFAVPIGPTPEMKELLDNMDLGDDVDPNDPLALSVRKDIAFIHEDLKNSYMASCP